jgi:copper chaperone CopZ
METTKFKTNIKCDACVAKVTPYLNESVGADQWQVDLTDPQRILTVTGQPDPEKVKDALKNAGYKAEKL